MARSEGNVLLVQLLVPADGLQWEATSGPDGGSFAGCEMLLKECLEQLGQLKKPQASGKGEMDSAGIQAAKDDLLLILQGLKGIMATGHYLKVSVGMSC